MLFNSWPFVAFLILVFAAFYLCPKKSWQMYILVVANLFFYAYSKPILLILLLFSATMDALISFAVARSKYKLLLTTIGVSSELALLALFKYPKLIFASFASSSGNPTALDFLMTIPLPIGISFYCFQGISLLVDSYRGQVPFKTLTLSQHISRTVFFVSFFPHLIAGPIVRAGEFMPQIEPKFFGSIRWEIVFRNIVIGFFFKVFVADNLALHTQNMANPGYSSVNLAAMLFAYSIQIFADFAGYSFIAIGLAALFGYKFPQNFNRPYISTSFSEFWTRWHMSLSTFLRNYLYIPLGGNRRGNLRTYLNLMIVMFLGGLWHGAAWSYAVWGLWHGVLLAIERFAKNAFPHIHLPKVIQIPVVFIFVTAAWLLFRLPNFSNVIFFFKEIVSNGSLPKDFAALSLIGVFSAPVIVYHAWALIPEKHFSPTSWLHRNFQRVEFCIYGLMIFLALVANGDSHEFIYFQF